MVGANDPSTTANIADAVWDELTADHTIANSVGQIVHMIRNAAIAGATASSLFARMDAAITTRLALTNFTFTRTRTTITATTLTNVLNKTTGGGVIYMIQLEDLDGAAGNDQVKINDIDASVIATITAALPANAFMKLSYYLNQQSDSPSVPWEASPSSGLESSVYFDTSLQFQLASHATPTSGVRGTIVYGDPPETWGHKQGKANELWEYMLELPTRVQIEEVYLMPELRKFVDAEIDVLRIDESQGKTRIWCERSSTQTKISDSMKLAIEKYLKQTYKHKKDTRKIDPITNQYLAPVVV